MFCRDWPQTPLGSLCEVMEPGFAREPRADNQGVIQLRMPNISDEGFVDLTVVKRVNATQAEVAAYRLQRGDVIFNNTNSPEIVGNAAVFDREEECLFSNHMTRLCVKPALADPGFVALVLHGYWKAGYSRTQAKHWVNQAAIDQPTLARFRIPLPPLSEQRRVVEILREAEAVRRLRADADRKTVELVPALFHEVFGDPLANPSGFERVKLGTVLSGIETGWSPKAQDRSAGANEWGVLKLGAVTTGEYIQSENKALRSDEAPAEELEVRAGDVLLTRKNTRELVAACAYVWTTRPRLVFSDLIFRLTLREESGLSAKYLWALLSQDSIRRSAQRLADGAAGSMPNIPKHRLANLLIPRPPQSLQGVFEKRLDQARSVVELQRQTLEATDILRHSLLSHAFTGELTASWRQRHARQLAEEAHQRDEALRAAGAAPARLPSAPEPEPEEAEDGRMSELSAEQRKLWKQLPERPFTAVSLAGEISGPLRNRPDAIRRHLEVFCARGLMLSVKRRRQDSAQRVELAQLYRKPTAAEEGWLKEQMTLLARSLGGNKS